MRTRDILLPSFLAIVLAFMINFMSCASQNRAGEDSFEETNEQQADLGNEQPAEEVKAEEVVKNENVSAGDPTLDALGEEKPAEPQGEGEMQKLDQASNDLGSAAPENEPNLLDQPLDNSSKSEPSNVSAETLPSAPPAVAYGGASVPKIPSKAIARKGATLNRFYFVRISDTPNNVSELIYGDTNHAAKLKIWNGGAWKAGKIIYYASAANPNDSVMRSFYQERNVVSQDYDVRRGDWLSTIAKKTLGSPDSWKEIAVVNGMQQPDDLEPNQKLAVYPRDLSPYAYNAAPADTTKNDVAQNEAVDEPAKNDFASSLPPVQDTPGLGNTTAPENEAPTAEPIPAATAPLKKMSGNKMDINKLIEQNLFTIVIGAGLVILLLALSAINRRRKARAGDDFGGDEGFAAPPKLRRK